MDEEPASNYKIDPYDISAALESLDGRTGVSPEEMANLEFLFISALGRSEHGIPNLEHQIAQSPGAFVQAVALAYKRRDGNQDPEEWQIADPERRKAVAEAAYELLDQIKRIPGTGSDGTVSAEALFAWVTEVRRLFVENGRAEIGDHQIGALLSRCPADENGKWPCLPVCEVMEAIASAEIASGFGIGVYNSRGVHIPGDEEELAAKYRAWATQYTFDYPYVGRVLERIAVDYDREARRHQTEAKVRKRLLD